MNVIMDSHVEALAFNYFNFAALTILNNLWTWLALLTAALSFWRIRTSAHPIPKHTDPTRITPDPVSEPLSSHAVTEETQSQSPRQILTVVSNGGVDDDVDGVRKGKFTVYYEEDVRGESEEKLTAFDGEGCGPLPEWWKCWERVLKVRNGESEKGWYTCQDLTELNGNVVRLWDGGLTATFGGGAFTRETCLNRNSSIIRC